MTMLDKDGKVVGHNGEPRPQESPPLSDRERHWITVASELAGTLHLVRQAVYGGGSDSEKLMNVHHVLETTKGKGR